MRRTPCCANAALLEVGVHLELQHLSQAKGGSGADRDTFGHVAPAPAHLSLSMILTARNSVQAKPRNGDVPYFDVESIRELRGMANDLKEVQCLRTRDGNNVESKVSSGDTIHRVNMITAVL